MFSAERHCGEEGAKELKMLVGDFLFFCSEPNPTNTASVPTGAVWVGTLPKANCSRPLQGVWHGTLDLLGLTDF